MSRRSFLQAYLHGEPVAADLPGGGLYAIMAFVIRENGISYMDDTCLDEMPTRHADHHLYGCPRFEGPDIFLSGHHFRALEGDDAERWHQMTHDKDIAAARKLAERRLTEIIAALPSPSAAPRTADSCPVERPSSLA